MTTVTIHGRFGEIIGKHHQFACSKLSDVFRALEANTGKLRRYMSMNRKRRMAMFVDGKVVNENNIDHVDVKNKKVVFVPLLLGAVGFTIVMKVTSLALADLTFKHIMIAMVINIAFAIGVSLVMSKMLAPDDPESASTSSYIFAAAENVTRQGLPVPVGYGRFKIGSVVLSASVINIDKNIATGSTFYENLFENTSNTEITESQINTASSTLAKSV